MDRFVDVSVPKRLRICISRKPICWKGVLIVPLETEKLLSELDEVATQIGQIWLKDVSKAKNMVKVLTADDFRE